MSKNKTPWRDIYSLETWLHIVKITAADFKRDRAGDTVRELTQLIAKYHMIDKRNSEQMANRKRMLYEIWATTMLYILPRDDLDTKSQKSAYDKGSDKVKRHKAKVNPLGRAVAFEDKIEPWINSLGNRAAKKVQYIRTIQKFVNSTAATNNVSSFIEYIKDQAGRDRSGPLLPLTPGTKMEKIDPFHRDFEFHGHKDGTITDPATDMARALKDWVEHGSDIPFFYWLEGHMICTGTKHFDPVKKISGVSYSGDSDETVLRVWLNGGLLRARGLLASDAGEPFTTKNSGTKPGHAFVWMKDGMMVSHTHQSGQFHHSTFSGGKKVRCAGTWVAKNGKLTRMDNNSGHYQPTDAHFCTLLSLIEKAGGTSKETRVGTHSTVPGFGGFFAFQQYMPISDYKKKVGETFVFDDNNNLYVPT